MGEATENPLVAAGERRLASVLFADLSGFTTMSEGMDPEDVHDLADRAARVMGEQVRQHGGTVVNVMGDAVMAMFGAPKAHGDDAERAVRAGLAIVSAISKVPGPVPLTVHVGINTGLVLAGAMGTEERRDYTAMGDTTNTASRLMSASGPSEVLVGHDTYAATRRAIRYETHKPVEAKGKQEPVEVWVAIEPITALPEDTSPFLGRGREMRQLSAVWESAVADRAPHLVTVLGPPGIGKSRLAREFALLATSEAARVVHGRCLPYGEQSGYEAFASLLRETCGVFVTDAQDTVRRKLDDLVSAVFPGEERHSAMRNLSPLLGVGGDDQMVNQLVVFFTARRLLECLGLDRATLVVLEDLHWAQPSELELLDHVVRQIRDAPVVLLALARPEFADSHPEFGSGTGSTTLPLRPLATSDATELAVQLIGSDGDGGVAAERLVEVTEGNPLFLEELAASARERKGEELPVTVNAAIAARIDAVPSDARIVLLAAAVVGQTFWRSALTAIGEFKNLDSSLDFLEARDMVRREPISLIAGDVQLTFRHILIREVAYATVSKAARRKWHQLVAKHLETTAQGSTEALASILAYHWQETEEPSRAVPYLLQAADAARRSWAKAPAIGLYDKALELTDDEAIGLEIKLKRALALVALEDYPTAIDEIDGLLPRLEGRQRLEALLAEGRATHWTEQDERTLSIGEEVLALAESLGEPELIPPAMAVLASGHQMRGAEGDIDRVLELNEKIFASWVPGTFEEELTHAMLLAKDVNYWTGQYERSVDLAHHTRGLAAEVHGPELLLRGGAGEAVALAEMGRHEEAIGIWDELLEAAKQLGRNPRVVLNYSALAYRELWDLAEARRRSEEALELSADMDFSMPRSFARSDLIFTDLLDGEIGAAQSRWPEMWAAAEHATAWTKWLIYGRLAEARAEIALRAESPDAAAEWADRALEITVRTRRRKYESKARLVRGQALLQMKRRDEAMQELQRAVAIADELIGPPARWEARAILGRSAMAAGDDGLAEKAYRDAERLVRDFATVLRPERAERLLAAPTIVDILSLTTA